MEKQYIIQGAVLMAGFVMLVISIYGIYTEEHK